jgi:hypothetical protein
MPILTNPRHEAFAQARAKGALLDDAYEDAGFTPCRGHASRLAREPHVAERIAELRGVNSEIDKAGDQAVIIALLRMAEASESKEGLAGLKEARQTLLLAHRLRADWTKRREFERLQLHSQVF